MLQGRFEGMNLLTGNIISRRKVNLITITQEVIDRVEALSSKYDIKYLLKFKDIKEVNIGEGDDENDDRNCSIAVVDDEDKEEYEPTKEDNMR